MARNSRPAEPLLARMAALAARVWPRRRAAAASAPETSDSAARPLEDMTPRAIEALVAEAFAVQGYSIVSSAEGVPMVLRKERATYVVQCKHWKASRIAVEVVRDLSEVMKLNGAAGGFVVSAGRVSREAHTFARLINVRFIDAALLKTLLAKARAVH